MPRLIPSAILALAAIAPMTIPSISHAQANCGQRDAVISKLEGRFGEHFAGGGLQNAKAIFEVWFSEEKGTWTILQTRADGTTCVMASGTNWREALPSMKPAGIPG